MVNRINDIIFDNLREGSLFDFEPTKIELIVDNWGAGIKTINKGEKGLIDVSLYDVYSNRDMDRIVIMVQEKQGKEADIKVELVWLELVKELTIKNHWL